MEAWEEIDDGATTWRFETAFLRSNWTCLWGRGCQGILAEPAEHLGQGCCSVGAHLEGDEAPTVAALALFLEPERFQHHAEAADGGVFSDDRRTNTRILDGACIFFNHPEFAGGPGCALHLAALDAGESPLDWKPSVCWHLPVKVDWTDRGDGGETATVRRWDREAWGEVGEEMAWCCTEGPEAYVGDQPVIDSLAEEIEEVVGAEVFVQLRGRLGSGTAPEGTEGEE